MIFDLAAESVSGSERYNVCVVGAGPVGLTIANELRHSGFRVCVMESGTRERTLHGESLSKVESVGIQIKPFSRERVLGGASTTWSGLSSPLDPIDMRGRAIPLYSGWPVTHEEMFRYWTRASECYRFPSASSFGKQALAIYRTPPTDLRWSALEEKIFLANAEALNFGQAFEGLFKKRLGFDLFLDATLISLVKGDNERIVSRGTFRASSGRALSIDADMFVLAAGGLDNPRILLNSKECCPAGLGNEYDQVGRYLMNHPKGYHGVISLRRPIREAPHYFGFLQHGISGYAGLRLKEEVQDSEGLLNSYIRFEPLYDWSGRPGVELLINEVKKGRVFAQWKKINKEKLISLRDYAESGDTPEFEHRDRLEAFIACLRDSPSILKYLFYRTSGRSAPQISKIRLRNFMEMQPVAENRVLLSDKVDPFGQPIPKVIHQTTELDRRSLIALHRVLARELSETGVGELESDLPNADPWPVDGDASHYLGTTRMGENKRESVVNSHGRLHSVMNVYLAGGSTFPTGGCANPTYTMIALAIRLAEDICKVFEPLALGVASPVKDSVRVR